jgi:hypothetical protein
MKLALSLILFIALVPAFTSDAAGQDPSVAAQSVASLQLQLIEVQAKEAELQARALQLDEDLKPENIERSLAGIGSTKPEELRELRRRQLSIERESLRTQLKLLAKSRERLESVIRTAETQAYQQSAEGTTLPVNQTLAVRAAATPGWRLGMLMGLFGVVGIAVIIGLARRVNISNK